MFRDLLIRVDLSLIHLFTYSHLTPAVSELQTESKTFFCVLLALPWLRQERADKAIRCVIIMILILGKCMQRRVIAGPSMVYSEQCIHLPPGVSLCYYRAQFFRNMLFSCLLNRLRYRMTESDGTSKDLLYFVAKLFR